MKQKHNKSERIGLKIVLGAAGGLLFGLSIREILIEYVLPQSLQNPWIFLLLGFLLLFAAAKV